MKAAFDLTCSDFPGACCDSCHDDEDWFDYTLPDGRVARVCCFKVRDATARRRPMHNQPIRDADGLLDLLSAWQSLHAVLHPPLRVATGDLNRQTIEALEQLSDGSPGREDEALAGSPTPAPELHTDGPGGER